MSVLCANARCRQPGQHTTDCQGTDAKPCQGCLPRRAASGALLCRYHIRHLGVDAVRLAELYADCEHALGGGRGEGGERVSGTQPGIELSENASAARSQISLALRSSAALIAAGRKVDLPWVWRLRSLPAGVQGPRARRKVYNLGHDALANFIGTHAEWLARQPRAAAISARFERLKGLGFAAAFPNGSRIIHIGPCPIEVEDAPCLGKVRALMSATDELLPSSIICDFDRTHQWRSDEWRALGRRLGIEVSGYMTAIEISIHYRRPLGTVYRLASEKHWRRTADGLRPVRYDWRDVDLTMRSVAA